MPRVKLELPSEFDFTTELPIRITDINYGGHLGNDTVLSLLHEARVRFLKHHGYTELNIEGAGSIMSDAVIVFKSEAFYGDVVVVEIALGDFERKSCDFLYRISNKETEKEIARAKTGIVFFDYQQRKPLQVPDRFRAKFARDESAV
ncbi:MAG: thioesterase family protein [Bacteroidota bacterium]